MIDLQLILSIICFMDIHFSIGELIGLFVGLGSVVGAYVQLYGSVKELKNDVKWIKEKLK